MKRISIFLPLILLGICSLQAQTFLPKTLQKLSSPDGAYEFSFYQKEISKGNNQIYYTLNFKGKTVVQESELGVLIENNTFESALGVPNDTCKIWGENLIFTKILRDTVNKTWTPVYGEYAQIKDNYNEMTLCFRKGEAAEVKFSDGYDKNKSYFMNVIVRAYNEGVAIRYHFPEPSNGLFLHITGEQTQFTMPDGTMAYYEPWAQGPYSLLPLKDWKGQSERPLTMKLTNGLTVAIAEAQMTDYARMKFSLNPSKANTLQASLYGSVDVIPAYSTPWRVIMVGEKAIDLIANKDIILNLNPENQLKDVSWIKPGKAIRVIKLTQADALKYVDFAAEHHLQYIMFDAGWYGPEMQIASSALKVSEKRDLNIPEIIQYGSSKGVGLWLYVNQRALIQQLDSILPLYKKWGVKGIKFGFVQVGNQRWTTWLHEAVKKCAEYGIMVDIHDEYRPTGFSRTYPNLLTQEGIGGNEEFPDADHNCTLPFTRFLAGPADYTICYYSSKIKNTHAHQLALSVLYYSPYQLLYWYDHPSQYKGESEIEFFDKVKTVWDDTRILNGEIGEYISVARRSGKEWFVGAITNNSPRRISIPTDFLSKKTKYKVTVFQDDDSVKTKTRVGIVQKIINGGDLLTYDLKASGGVALHITEMLKSDYVDIGDAKLYYEEKGKGKPLILLHAHSVDRRMWDAQFDELAKKFRVIRYDLRGYGLSSMPVEGKDFTHAYDLEKFMDALKIKKAHLAGLSLGTLTISDFMTIHPERVLSATLAAGGMSFDLKPKDPEKDMITFKDNWKKSMRKGSCNYSPFLMSLIDDWQMWQVSHRESSKIFLGTAARTFYQNNKIDVPVLFIVGECDSAGAKKAATDLAALIPESKIVNITNAGHFSCIEQPVVFNKAMLEFISGK